MNKSSRENPFYLCQYTFSSLPKQFSSLTRVLSLDNKPAPCSTDRKGNPLYLQYVCVVVYLSLHLWVVLSICVGVKSLYVSVYVCVCASLSPLPHSLLSVFLSLYMSVWACVHAFMYTLEHECVRVCVCVCVCGCGPSSGHRYTVPLNTASAVQKQHAFNQWVISSWHNPEII